MSLFRKRFFFFKNLSEIVKISLKNFVEFTQKKKEMKNEKLK